MTQARNGFVGTDMRRHAMALVTLPPVPVVRRAAMPAFGSWGARTAGLLGMGRRLAQPQPAPWPDHDPSAAMRWVSRVTMSSTGNPVPARKDGA